MMEKLLQTIVFPIVYLLSLFVPKDGSLWLFSAWFGRKYEDSPRAIFERCVENGDTSRNVYWIYKGARPAEAETSPGNFVNCYSAKGVWLQLRAKVFVLCVNSRDFLPGAISVRSFVVQTWHGTPMKQIGYDMLKGSLFDLLKFWIRRYLTDNYSIVLSPNAYTDSVFCRAFQLPQSRMLRAEYPRNLSMLLSERKRNEIRSNLFRSSGNSIWIYLPTHRNEGQDADATRNGYRSILDLSPQLAELNVEIAFKPHFYEESLLGQEPENENVYTLKAQSGYSLYEVLGAVDGLITDYSSVAYDFSIVSRNIIIYAFDEKQFREEHRDLVRVPSDDFNVIVETPSALLRSIENLSQSDASTGSQDGGEVLDSIIGSLEMAVYK